MSFISHIPFIKDSVRQTQEVEETPRNIQDELADEGASGTPEFSGHLAFAEKVDHDRKVKNIYEVQKTNSCISEDMTGVDSQGKFHALETIVFEVTRAECVTEGRHTFVVYWLMVIKTPGLDERPTVIKRRYTDFHNLHEKLKEQLPDLIKPLDFPKKLLIGNFKFENIKQRSRAFENYLSALYSIERIRNNEHFLHFFYVPELSKAYDCIRSGDYADGVPIMTAGLHIQQKLLGERHAETIATLCGLIVLYNMTENLLEALAKCEKCLSSIGSDVRQVYLVPLLQLSIRLCWSLGKDKRHLEQWLHDLRTKGLDVDGAPTLLEMAVRRFATNT